MAKQQRTMRVEQRSQLAAMQQMESRSDEELEAETKFKAAAQAIAYSGDLAQSTAIALWA